MHKQAVAPLIYNHLFPNPKPSDPTTFAAHISRNLVPEVRVETATFYGALDCIEAQYPGLDYSKSAHRMRLGRFPWHRLLFRAFDELRLTDNEIASLCRWEGTLWARQRYERDEGVKVRDTTGDEIPTWVSPHRRAQKARLGPGEELTRYECKGLTDSEDDEEEEEEEEGEEQEDEDMEDSDDAGIESEEEEEIQSVGVELNQRLLAATAARARGEEVVLDADWEQWLKEAAERGTLTDVSDVLRAGMPPVYRPGLTSHPQLQGRIATPPSFTTHVANVPIPGSSYARLRPRMAAPSLPIPAGTVIINGSAMSTTSTAPPAGTAI
ncbi:MAG: hypothetical protein M1830_009356 [Pleopsidium flavum]|nr:MAG: hypothetical protein M1830_009356 [Pleopsidium flavum]